jgi:hypothetical protein
MQDKKNKVQNTNYVFRETLEAANMMEDLFGGIPTAAENTASTMPQKGGDTGGASSLYADAPSVERTKSQRIRPPDQWDAVIEAYRLLKKTIALKQKLSKKLEYSH